MGKCNICGVRPTEEARFYTRPTAGECPLCEPQVSPAQDACFCPPIGEPKLLTLLAPVIFDECGINLCRVVDITKLEEVDPCKPCCDSTDFIFGGITKRDLIRAETVQLQVADIDFNFAYPGGCRRSEIEPSKDRPNCSRITLRDIDVTFAVKILDLRCRVRKEGFLVLRYLPKRKQPGFNEETNPSSVTVDLYTPYGVSYEADNPLIATNLVPTVNFIGYIEEPGKTLLIDKSVPLPPECRLYGRNNEARQGICAQALAKVVAKDDEDIAIGLTIYFKAMYFVQYRVCHQGLAVPPKCEPVGPEASKCVEFVEGGLLEQSIQPLEVSCPSQTVSKRFRPVKDPTPSQPCNGEVGGIEDDDDDCNCNCCR